MNLPNVLARVAAAVTLGPLATSANAAVDINFESAPAGQALFVGVKKVARRKPLD